MEETIFRKKSLDSIASPDDLDTYLKVTTPAVWTALVAIVVLLAGFVMWSAMGSLETTVTGDALATDSKVVVTIQGEGAVKVSEKMPVRIGNLESTIDSVTMDEYGRAVATASFDVPDGKYEAQIVIEDVSPVTFLLE